MRSSDFFSVRQRNGYAMIILIVVIALGVLAFILQKAGVLSMRPTDPDAPGIMPWTEFKIRQQQQSASQSPSAEQPKITSLEYDGNVRQPDGGKSRGEIRLYLGQNGVNGTWYGYYHAGSEKQYDITGSGFSGSFYPEKKYVDGNGNEGASKLYFLCKGEFQMQETGRQMVRILAGEIYVRGWLDKDNMIDGRVFITSNYKDYHEFEFKGVAGAPSGLNLNF